MLKIHVLQLIVKCKIGTVIGTLIVLNEPMRVMLSCTKEIDSTSKVTDKIAIGNANTYVGYAYRLNEFTFADQNSYNEVVGEKPETINYNTVSGKAIYDDANLTLGIKYDLTTDQLNSDFGGTFPTAYSDIFAYYTSPENGYTCTIER